MITIEYCAEGEPVSDFEYRDWLEKIKNYPDGHFQVSTTIPIQAVRLAVARGVLPHQGVCFLYESKIIRVNEYGAILDWPPGFADVDTYHAEEILRTAMARRRRERSQAQVHEVR